MTVQAGRDVLGRSGTAVMGGHFAARAKRIAAARFERWRDEAEAFASILSHEAGKPLTEARGKSPMPLISCDGSPKKPCAFPAAVVWPRAAATIN